jgi:hypothetical protein
MGDQLTEFLRRKEQARRPEIDWQAKKDEWAGRVEGLYVPVRKMLRKSIESKAVTVRTFDVEVTEDYIGTYTMPALEMRVGGTSEWTVVLQRVRQLRTAALDRNSLKYALERAMLPLP